ncbi:MAG: monovalent cation/H(+) antiporter subunit G [Flavobacteriales bacterium]|nr:monovalent cation/H(+) antiporter subunit G [Flavobacteriales bacterium]
MISQYITLACVWLGIIFILIAAIGIIRMPDVYTRMSAVTKAVALGVGLILVGVVFHFNDTTVMLKATVIFVFLVFSLSVAAHVIGLAAYEDRTPMTDLTFHDALKEEMGEGKAPALSGDPDAEES